MADEITKDGYTIIPPRKEPMFGDDIPKGIQCGQCGARFDKNKAYGYMCQDSRCPIQPRTY